MALQIASRTSIAVSRSKRFTLSELVTEWEDDGSPGVIVKRDVEHSIEIHTDKSPRRQPRILANLDDTGQYTVVIDGLRLEPVPAYSSKHARFVGKVLQWKPYLIVRGLKADVPTLVREASLAGAFFAGTVDDLPKMLRVRSKIATDVPHLTPL